MLATTGESASGNGGLQSGGGQQVPQGSAWLAVMRSSSAAAAARVFTFGRHSNECASTGPGCGQRRLTFALSAPADPRPGLGQSGDVCGPVARPLGLPGRLPVAARPDG